ncbi:MAG: PilW family protein [Rhodocyclaceae bacterium]|nr:PilW family protein [Rhodocyclaceae bacterium]
MPVLRIGTRQHGFTIIELLVALVIGLIGSLAIMQIYVGSEAGKRATGSLAEAQGGGMVALYAIERELQQAGLGFMHLAALGCRLQSDTSVIKLDNVPLQPVTIIPAGATQTDSANLWGIPPGDANSDMIAIAAGDASAMVEGTITTIAAASGATTYRLSSVLGLANGDWLLLSEAGKDCTLTRVESTNIDGDVTVTYGGVSDYAANSRVLHLGRAPTLVVYAVRNGTLTRCDFLASDCTDAGQVNNTTVWVPVANDVVAIAAQYGFDTSATADMTVENYCKSRVPPGGQCPATDDGMAAPGMLSATQPARACDWARVPIVQLALVSRSGQYEKEEVSPASIKLWPDNTNDAVPPTTRGPVWNVPDRHYRYRVARTAVALRNVIWMGAQSTC